MAERPTAEIKVPSQDPKKKKEEEKKKPANLNKKPAASKANGDKKEEEEKLSGDSCNSIEDAYTISFSDLLQWNLEINTTCGNLALASYYVQGSNACTTVYRVQSENTCSPIETQFGITSAQLVSDTHFHDTNIDHDE